MSLQQGWTVKKLWEPKFMEQLGQQPYVNPLALELDIYSLAHHLCKT